MPPENNQAPVVPTPPSSSSSSIPPAKIGKFKASKTIVKESWAILKQDKEIMWFPVISSISTLVAFLVMGIIFYFLVLGGDIDTLKSPENAKELNNVVVYSSMLVYYVVIFFIVNFFQAGLYIIVQGRFSGKDLSFGEGMSEAQKHMGRIFMWSLISATVGVILQIISDRSKLVGKIVASVFGAAWNILTYFSLPSLIIGNLSIKDSFKESASIIRKTWGEIIIINFGVGLFFSLIIFLIFALSIGIMVIVPTFYVFVSVVVLFLIALIIISVISSTLSSIFKLALFNYARTGVIPQGFSTDIIRGAVR